MPVRVKRDGGRGHHLIDDAKYNANPSAFVRCDEDGAAIEAAKPVLLTSGQATLGSPNDPPAPSVDLEAMTVADLKALAAERTIDLGDATKKADIIAAIEAAETV